MSGEWVRKPKGPTTVVYVHGILSSGETCWKHSNGAYWPTLLKEDADLEEVGIYIFSYETSIFSGTYSLSDVVDALKEYIKLDGVIDSKCIVFVCHSMGGIVVRKYLVERRTELIEHNTSIGLFLVASPSLGSTYANWLSPLAQFLGHLQADALRFRQNNTWLNSLDKEFLNVKEANRLRMSGKELVEDKFIVLKKWWRKQVVAPFSGARYFGEPFKVPESDHFSIAKPDSPNSIQHRLLCTFIKESVKSTRDQGLRNTTVSVETMHPLRMHNAPMLIISSHDPCSYEYHEFINDLIIQLDIRGVHTTQPDDMPQSPELAPILEYPQGKSEIALEIKEIVDTALNKKGKIKGEIEGEVKLRPQESAVDFILWL